MMMTKYIYEQAVNYVANYLKWDATDPEAGCWLGTNSLITILESFGKALLEGKADMAAIKTLSEKLNNSLTTNQLLIVKNWVKNGH